MILFVYYHWSQNNAQKRKLGAICVLRGQKRPLKSKTRKNFDGFFFQSTISPEPLFRFWIFFCKLLPISFNFLIKEEKFIKNFKISKKCIYNFWPTNRNLSILKLFGFWHNFEVILKPFILSKKRIKLSANCKKHHQNRTNGFGDINYREWRNIKVLRLWGFPFLIPRDTNAPQFSFLCITCDRWQ